MKQHLEKIPVSIRQFIKFCIVGVLNTAIDTLAYIFFTRIFGIFYLLANIFAFVISSTNSYYLNRIFTFKSAQDKKKLEYSKFISVLLVGLVIAEIVLFICVHFFNLNDIVGKLIAIAIVLFWNFFGSKFFVFKIRK